MNQKYLNDIIIISAGIIAIFFGFIARKYKWKFPLNYAGAMIMFAALVYLRISLHSGN